MERREFLKTLGLAGAGSVGIAGMGALGCRHPGLADAGPESAPAPALDTESRRAWAELVALLDEVDRRYLSPAWNILFWRFLLPEGEIPSPRASLVPITEVQS